MAVDPALGVDHVADGGTGTTDRELVATALQVIQQGLNLGLGVEHELDVVPSGEAQVAVTMLIGDVAQFTDMLDADQTGGTDADGVALVTGLALVHQDAGLQDLVIEPLAVVVLDDRREKLFKVRRTDVCDSVFHRIFRIVTHNLSSLS